MQNEEILSVIDKITHLVKVEETTFTETHAGYDGEPKEFEHDMNAVDFQANVLYELKKLREQYVREQK